MRKKLKKEVDRRAGSSYNDLCVRQMAYNFILAEA